MRCGNRVRVDLAECKPFAHGNAKGHGNGDAIGFWYREPLGVPDDLPLGVGDGVGESDR